MRDLITDWKKWSSAERLLAMVLIVILVGVPLRVLIAGASLSGRHHNRRERTASVSLGSKSRTAPVSKIII